MSDDQREIPRELARRRRTERAWRRAIREDGGSLSNLQLAVCEARLIGLTRDRIAAEREAEVSGWQCELQRGGK